MGEGCERQHAGLQNRAVRVRAPAPPSLIKEDEILSVYRERGTVAEERRRQPAELPNVGANPTRASSFAPVAECRRSRPKTGRLRACRCESCRGHWASWRKGWRGRLLSGGSGFESRRGLTGPRCTWMHASLARRRQWVRLPPGPRSGVAQRWSGPLLRGGLQVRILPPEVGAEAEAVEAPACRAGDSGFEPRQLRQALESCSLTIVFLREAAAAPPRAPVRGAPSGGKSGLPAPCRGEGWR